MSDWRSADRKEIDRLERDLKRLRDGIRDVLAKLSDEDWDADDYTPVDDLNALLAPVVDRSKAKPVGLDCEHCGTPIEPTEERDCCDGAREAASLSLRQEIADLLQAHVLPLDAEKWRAALAAFRIKT